MIGEYAAYRSMDEDGEDDCSTVGSAEFAYERRYTLPWAVAGKSTVCLMIV